MNTRKTTSQEANPFVKAERHKAKVRIALCGPSGSGKTYSALRLAKGLGEKIAMIDTEQGSSELYVGEKGIPPFDRVFLDPPYSPERYISLIKAAEKNGYDVIIIDSLSPAWAGTGGILDIHSSEEIRQRNGFRAWKEVTPKHNELINAIILSECHVIVTIRSKQDWIIEKDSEGKTQVKKHGLAPIQREGIEYEFCLFLDLNSDHKAVVSKTRMAFLDKQVFVPAEEHGKQIKEWLESAESNDKKEKS